MLVKKHYLEELHGQLQELEEANRKDPTKDFALRATSKELNDAVDVRYEIFCLNIFVAIISRKK